MAPVPHILVTNDDGITAPGLKALVAHLSTIEGVEVSVCAPAGERSAQSHALTVGPQLTCHPHDCGPGIKHAFAVDGTPADSVMLALNSPLFQLPNSGKFDLVVSGINRGDNNGLHVLYSGTVGAAREAACKGIPAIALSLDHHGARSVEAYEQSAKLSVAIIKATLGILPNKRVEAPFSVLRGSGTVLNVNFPRDRGQNVQGLYLTHQSEACVWPSFAELPSATPPSETEPQNSGSTRVFRNSAGCAQPDDSEGGDSWAVKQGWVSVTPLGLRQDLRVCEAVAIEHLARATAAIVEAAAAEGSLPAGGTSKL